jgi:hypothetical protein
MIARALRRGGLWLALAFATGAPATAFAAPAPPPVEDERPEFPLPDVGDTPEPWAELLAPGLLAAPSIAAGGPGAVAPPSRWTLQLPPLLPEPHAAARPAAQWWIGGGTGPGGVAGLDRPLGAGRRGRIAADVWADRIPNRDRTRVEAGVAAAPDTPLPEWGAALDLGVGGEGWEADASHGRALPGATHATVASGRLRRRLGVRSVLGLEAEVGETSARLDGPAVLDARLTGGWRSIGLGLGTAGSGRDLRRYAPETGSDRAPVDVGLWAGVAHRRSPGGESGTVGRWRAHLTGTVLRGDWHLDAGLAGAGEARRALIGPTVEARRFWRERDACAAVRVAPELLFAEEALGLGERIPEASLIRESGRAAPLPETPVVLDPRLAPQRAWPAVTGEYFHGAAGGWWDLGLSVARLRDPVDWRADTLGAGTTLLRSASAASRWLARLALAVRRPLGARAGLTLRYRWVHDPRGGDPARALHALSAHRVTARLDGRGGRWRWSLSADARGRAPAAAGEASFAPTFALGARLGCALGATELWIVGANLLDDAIRDEPYASLTRRWVGLQWNLPFGASVP